MKQQHFVLQNINTKQIIGVINWSGGYKLYLENTICTAICEFYNADEAEIEVNTPTNDNEFIYLICVKADHEPEEHIQFELISCDYYITD